MPRNQTPRVRHLNHRRLDRTRYQDHLLDFVGERAATLTQYADEAAVWDALRTSKATIIADEADIPAV